MHTTIWRCLFSLLPALAVLPAAVPAQSIATQTTEVKTELQPWQEREVEFFQIAKKAQAGDAEARQALDAVLTEFETHPMSRTPMENMDILGVFYVPKEGFEKCLPIVAMNAALGWYDALRYGSESGRAEIVNNRQFFRRALMLSGPEKSKQAVKFIEENPERARALVEQGLGFAEQHKNAPDYDHQWPSAFGLERLISNLGGKEAITPIPKEDWDKTWEESKKRVREFYIATHPAAKKSEPSKATPPTTGSVTPPAGAGS